MKRGGVYGAALEGKDGDRWEMPTLSGTIPTCEYSGANFPGIEPSSPWRDASTLTAALPRNNFLKTCCQDYLCVGRCVRCRVSLKTNAAMAFHRKMIQPVGHTLYAMYFALCEECFPEILTCNSATSCLYAAALRRFPCPLLRACEVQFFKGIASHWRSALTAAGGAFVFEPFTFTPRPRDITSIRGRARVKHYSGCEEPSGLGPLVYISVAGLRVDIREFGTLCGLELHVYEDSEVTCDDSDGRESGKRVGRWLASTREVHVQCLGEYLSAGGYPSTHVAYGTDRYFTLELILPHCVLNSISRTLCSCFARTRAAYPRVTNYPVTFSTDACGSLIIIHGSVFGNLSPAKYRAGCFKHRECFAALYEEACVPLSLRRSGWSGPIFLRQRRKGRRRSCGYACGLAYSSSRRCRQGSSYSAVKYIARLIAECLRRNSHLNLVLSSGSRRMPSGVYFLWNLPYAQAVAVTRPGSIPLRDMQIVTQLRAVVDYRQFEFKCPKPMRIIEDNIERRQNEGVGETGDPEKTRRPTASSGPISTCENMVNRPGIEPGSPWGLGEMEEAVANGGRAPISHSVNAATRVISVKWFGVERRGVGKERDKEGGRSTQMNEVDTLGSQDRSHNTECTTHHFDEKQHHVISHLAKDSNCTEFSSNQHQVGVYVLAVPTDLLRTDRGILLHMRESHKDPGKRVWRRYGKESAMAFDRDPSQHSPGVIFGNHRPTECESSGLPLRHTARSHKDFPDDDAKRNDSVSLDSIGRKCSKLSMSQYSHDTVICGNAETRFMSKHETTSLDITPSLPVKALL
ncbi:hypothetical protein PR048_017717 [Dryococelus australis]|uniref:Uncharacterized protein n=1 Tax=Dryococelus australis TaxID=614101 RepID=A0ABQ9HAJ7_9NEOP|nr:hypothetical protein PR048_017717 [Dryococelus australis]